MANRNALTALGRSGNPMFRGTAFNSNLGEGLTDTMTLGGTVNKTGVLLILCIVTASISWNRYFASADGSSVNSLMWIGMIVGFVLALITVFKKHLSPITAPLYALAQGFFLGGISAIFEDQYPGIAIQATGLTFGTLGFLLLAYKSGLIKPTENFRLIIFAATGGIAILYLISFVMSFFGSGIGFIHSNGLFGIGFSLFVVGIAALNLVLDFDFIEQAADQGAPKFLEWYGAFSLMVTLIWLYIEILRLLAKIRSR